jgi:WD40 repeat protein/serine/threonine protein kinase
MQPAHMTSGARKCPKCGAELHDGVLGGLCPACATRLVCQTGGADEAAALLSADGKPQAPTALVPLRYFGDYELLGEVGRGGMGIVYKARQLSLHRLVALKLIAPEQLALPKAVERFHTEAEAAAHLDHPNIVPIYETGERDGRHYFSMKLIEGQSLAQRIADFKLPSGESKTARPDASPSLGGEGRGEGGRSAYAKSAIRNRQSAIASLLAKVADAVHYAHQRGILHRDLKPGNILIDSAGEPHVTDFGLAKLIEGDSSLTLSGEVLGTPAYMAPEQASGKTRQMTTAADIYSLGVILYELLTGRPPFRGETPMETLHALLHTEPEAPRSLNRAVPRDLETICLKCLEKEPARRFTSARALAEDLRRFIGGEPVQARPIGAAGKVWRWCRRKPALAATLLGLQIALALGLAGILWEWRQAKHNAAEALASELAARQSLYASDISLAQQALAADNLRQALDLLQRHVPKPGQPDLRGFEWRCLWRQCQSDELFSLSGHAIVAASLAFSPEGRTLATGSSDRTVKIWDLASKRATATLTDFTQQVNSVSFSGRGNVLAAASPTSVGVWDSRTFRLLRWLPGAAGKSKFCPSGDYLVTRSTNRGLVLWQTHTWTAVKTLVPTGSLPRDRLGNLYSSPELGLAFAPNGAQVGVVSDAGVRLLSVPEFQEVAVLADRIPRIRFLAFSPDRHMLAACTTPDSDVKLWDVESQKAVRALSGHSDSIYAAAFSPDGDRLATCSADQTVKLWNVANGNLLRTFRGHVDEVLDVDFSPDGNLLASASKDGIIKLWDVSAKASQNPLAESVSPLGFTADGSFLALATNDLLIAFDPATLQREATQEFCGHEGETNRLFGALLAGGNILPLLIANPGRSQPRLQLWDLLRSDLMCSVDAVDPFPAYAPKKGLLATVTTNDTISLWQLPEVVRRCVLTNCSSVNHNMAFSADESLLATPEEAEAGYETRLWSVHRNELHERALQGQNKRGFDGFAFSPDSRMLARGNWNGLISVWRLPSGAVMATLTGHKRAGVSLSFSPDGRTLASFADDGAVRLWHVATWRELISFRMPCSDPIGPSVGFSPDGRSLFASRLDSSGRLNRVWFAPSFAEIAVAEGKDYRSLAQDAATWHAVGKVLEKRNRFDEALQAFTEVVRRCANQPDLEALRKSALLGRAKLLIRLARVAEAAADNLAALNLPARDTRTPARLLDFSPYFNGTLDWNNLPPKIPPEAFLTGLPRGLQILPAAGGVQFDVRGVVQLNNDADFPGVPAAVAGIAMRHKCRRLHFLHATHGWETSGTLIGSYVLHYADGKQEEVPIVYGRDLTDWVPVSADAADLQGAKLAWKGKDGHRVYMSTWENPRPDMEIASLDFVSKLTKCGPFLIAITAEP